jgi:hypothetical protein
MSEKKIPPPPVLPPSSSLKKNFCLLHKGEIDGETYVCPKCKAVYCLDCAKKAEKDAALCIKCKQLILV